MNSIPFETDVTNPYLAQAVALSQLFALDAVERDKAGGQPAEQLQQLKQSNLLNLVVDRQWGGHGQPISTAFRVTRELARTDAALGHLYGYHVLCQHAAYLHSNLDQAGAILSDSVINNAFWANNGNSIAKSLQGQLQDNGNWVLNGAKPFTSGSHIADQITISWLDEQTGRTHAGAIPASREGWQPLNDWDAFGQRQTGSGTTTYNNVVVHANEVYAPEAGTEQAAFRTVNALFQQSVLLNVFLGSAQGALLAAKGYTLGQSRSWVHSGVARHEDDPWVKRVYGDLYTKLLAAQALADQALDAADAIWERGFDLNATERGRAAIPIAAANAFCGNVALEVSSKIFEVMGARSTANDLGLDRFWRNIRTHTLHNPEEYKTRNVGYWFLTGEPPKPSFIQ